jgi:hypothetical protein
MRDVTVRDVQDAISILRAWRLGGTPDCECPAPDIVGSFADTLERLLSMRSVFKAFYNEG